MRVWEQLSAIISHLKKVYTDLHFLLTTDEFHRNTCSYFGIDDSWAIIMIFSLIEMHQHKKEPALPLFFWGGGGNK